MIDWMLEHWFIEAVCIIGSAIVMAILVRKFADLIGE